MKYDSLIAALCLLVLCGCRTPAPWPAVDLAQPGWRVQESQVVWTPRKEAAPLVGELMVATHGDGRTFTQFSKQGLPMISVQTAGNLWRLDAPMFHRVHQGRGAPTSRVPWFQFRTLPPAPPVAEPWRLEPPSPDGAWKLFQARTGEAVEGGAP